MTSTVLTGSDQLIQTCLSFPQTITNKVPIDQVDTLQAGERKNPQTESYGRNPNEKILNIQKIMSHDIRGSLLSISATLKLLRRGYYGSMEESVANSLNELLSKTIGLIGLTEEYLFRTFSFNDDFEMDQELLDLKKDIIDPVLEEFSPEIRDRHIQIENRIGAIPSRIFIKGSKICLKAIFRNLLRNAIKYGDMGGKVVFGLEEYGPSLRLNVYNSGKPISEENRDKLFSKFARIGINENGNATGMGLGLYLIKRIIQNHGGDIWYEAKEDGSNFVLTLPQDHLKSHE
jgi:signal transduction histidine kinase